MTDLLRQLGEQQVAAFFLVLGRVSPLFMLAPLFSSSLLPARARGIAAVAFAVGLSPLVGRGVEVPLDPIGIGGLMLKEILTGTAFAYAVAAVFAAVSTAGSFLDTLVGFAYGSLVDPLTGNQSPVFSQIYGLVGVMVFIAIGGDVLMVQGLERTYDLVPLLAFPDVTTLVAGAQGAFSGVFRSALEIAAPVLIALVITDAALGVLARVLPQLNVFAVGFPAKIAVGIVLIGASMPFAGGYMADSLEQSVSDALGALRAV